MPDFFTSSLRNYAATSPYDLLQKRAQADLRTPEQQYVDQFPGSTQRGFTGALHGISAGSFANEALAAEQAGDMEKASALRQSALRAAQQAGAVAPDIRSTKDVHGLGDAFEYAKGALGQGVGTTLPAIGGALAARVLGPRFLGPLREYAGAAIPAYGMEKGEAVLNQYQDPVAAAAPVEERARVAEIKGGVNALLEAGVPGSLVRNFAKQGAAGGFLKQVLGTAGKEGTTELAQNIVGQEAQRALNPQVDLEKNKQENLDAFLQGAVAGGGMAMPGAVAANIPAAIDRVSKIKSLPLVQDALDKFDVTTKLKGLSRAGDDTAHVGASFEETMQNMQAAQKVNPDIARKFAETIMQDPDIAPDLKASVAKADMSTPEGQKLVGDVLLDQITKPEVESAMKDINDAGNMIVRKNEESPDAIHEVVKAITDHIKPEVLRLPGAQRHLSDLAKVLGNLTARGQEIDDSTLRAFGGFKPLEALTDDPQALLDSVAFAVGTESTLNGRFQKLNTATEDAKNPDSAYFVKAIQPEALNALSQYNQSAKNALYKRMAETIDDVANGRLSEKAHNDAFAQLEEVFGKENANAVVSFYAESNGAKRMMNDNGISGGRGGKVLDSDEDSGVVAPNEDTATPQDMTRKDVYKNAATRMPYYEHERETSVAQTKEVVGTGKPRLVPYAEHVEATGGNVMSEATRIRNELARQLKASEDRKTDRSPQRAEREARQRAQIAELDAAMGTGAKRRSNEVAHTQQRELDRLIAVREQYKNDVGEMELAGLDEDIAAQKARVEQAHKDFVAAAKTSPSSAAAQRVKAVYDVLQKYHIGTVEEQKGVGTITADRSFIQRSKIGLKARVRNEQEKVLFKMADGSVMALHAPSMIREARKLLTDDSGKTNAERTMNVFHAAVSAVLGREDVVGLANEKALEDTVLNNPNAKDRRDTVAKLRELDKALDVALQNKDRVEVGRLSMERELELEHLKEISGEELKFGQLRQEQRNKQERLKELDKVKEERKAMQDFRTRLSHFLEAWAQERKFDRSEKAVQEIASDLKWDPKLVRAHMEKYGVKGAFKAEFARLRREINARTALIMRWDEKEFSKYEHDPESNEGATDMYQSMLDANPTQMAREEEYKDYNVNEPGAAPGLWGPSDVKTSEASMEPATKPVTLKDRHPELKEWKYDRWDAEDVSPIASHEAYQKALFAEEDTTTPKRSTPAAKKLADQKAAIRKSLESTDRRRKAMDEADQAAVKEIITRLRGDERVSVFLDKTFKELGQASGTFRFNTQTKVAAIFVAANAMNPQSVAYHESLHDFFHSLGNGDQARALKAQMQAFASSPAVLNQLRKLLEGHPKALKAMETSAEERLAYAFQFWATGTLRTGPATENFFTVIGKMIRKLLGIMSTDEKVLAIFTAFNEGKFVDTNTVYAVLHDRGIETLSEKAKRLASPIYDAAVKLFTVSTDRLRDFNSEALAEVADMFHKDPDREGGGMGFLQKRAMVNGQWLNKLQTIFEGTNAEQQRKALEELQAQKPQSDLALKLRAYLDEMYDYSQKSGVLRAVGWDKENQEVIYEKIRKVKNFFPRLWDVAALRANREEFISDIMFEAHMDAREAEGIYNTLIGSSGQEDITEGVKRPAGFSPFAKSVLGRQLTFITPKNAAKFAKYQEKDIAHTMSQYTTQLVHRAEYTKMFDNSGEVLKELFGKAKAEGVSDTQLLEAAKIVQGLEGTLNWDMDQKWRNIMTGAITYQNIVLLPFSLFSNLIDPIGVGVRSGSMTEAFNALREGIMGLLGGGNKEAMQMAKDLGIIDENNLLDAMGMIYNGKYMNSTLKKANKWFFKLNGMESWNQRMRVAAMVAGERFIEKHKAGANEHSARYMKELGLEKWNGDKSAREYKEALFQFVDGAVLRPNAAQRPVWGNDPHWMLVFHLKQFTYSFQKVIMNRVAHEFEHGNTQAAWMLASYVPFMIVSDVLRGALTGGVRKTWTLSDYLVNGVTRSGVMGIGNFGADALQDAAMGGVPGMSFAGPTAGHAIFAAQTLGPMKDFHDLVMRSIPAAPLVKSIT